VRRCLLGLIVASVLWGGAVSGTKFALGGFAPVTLLATELAAAAAVLWLALLARGYRAPRVWWLPVVLGLLEPALAYLGETLGLSMTSAVHGALLSGLESALVVVLAALVLRETVTVAAAVAVLAATLVGVAGYGASFLIFNSVISRVGATQAAVVLNLIPVFAFLGATVFLGEGVTSADVIGAALVGASVVYFTAADHYA
jgi:drug/metabolite transporter (DMT)-like permease